MHLSITTLSALVVKKGNWCILWASHKTLLNFFISPFPFILSLISKKFSAHRPLSISYHAFDSCILHWHSQWCSYTWWFSKTLLGLVADWLQLDAVLSHFVSSPTPLVVGHTLSLSTDLFEGRLVCCESLQLQQWGVVILDQPERGSLPLFHINFCTVSPSSYHLSFHCK